MPRRIPPSPRRFVAIAEQMSKLAHKGIDGFSFVTRPDGKTIPCMRMGEAIVNLTDEVRECFNSLTGRQMMPRFLTKLKTKKGTSASNTPSPRTAPLHRWEPPTHTTAAAAPL